MRGQQGQRLGQRSGVGLRLDRRDSPAGRGCGPAPGGLAPRPARRRRRGRSSRAAAGRSSSGQQAGRALAELRRVQRGAPVGAVQRLPAPAGLAVERAAERDEGADVGDRVGDPVAGAPRAPGARPGRDRGCRRGPGSRAGRRSRRARAAGAGPPGAPPRRGRRPGTPRAPRTRRGWPRSPAPPRRPTASGARGSGAHGFDHDHPFSEPGRGAPTAAFHVEPAGPCSSADPDVLHALDRHDVAAVELATPPLLRLAVDRGPSPENRTSFTWAPVGTASTSLSS